jgi:hypothetical protein
VKARAFVLALFVCVVGATSCGKPSPEGSSVRAKGTVSPTQHQEQVGEESLGFYPPSRFEGDQVVMPLTFVDGSRAEAVAPRDLGIQDMTAQMFTAAGLGGVDRTIGFAYGNGSAFMHEGPLETYEGTDGSEVELWEPGTEMPAGCPYLVYRFGEWFVGVRTCQDELSDSEKRVWARSLSGLVTDEGWLVLSSLEPLVLQKTGGHEGPEIILGMGRADWIELEPGRCNQNALPDEGDIRTMSDGTKVSFSRIEDGASGIDYDWFATWCEDGLMMIQVSYAYKEFAEVAAESFRLSDIVLAEK